MQKIYRPTFFCKKTYALFLDNVWLSILKKNNRQFVISMTNINFDRKSSP